MATDGVNRLGSVFALGDYKRGYRKFRREVEALGWSEREHFHFALILRGQIGLQRLGHVCNHSVRVGVR
jgi:hypothetical protein